MVNGAWLSRRPACLGFGGRRTEATGIVPRAECLRRSVTDEPLSCGVSCEGDGRRGRSHKGVADTVPRAVL